MDLGERGRSLCAGFRCHLMAGLSTMSSTPRPSVAMSSFPTRAGRTWCCRWLSGMGASGWDGGPAPVPALTLVLVSVSQGNQMSIAFLEMAHPSPGHIHRGQLQLVEVSRAGQGPVVFVPHDGGQPSGLLSDYP